jgi:hypothetical protein
MVTDEFRELNKETSKTLVERERERRKRRDPRGRREREGETEGETERKRTEGHGSLRWRFSGGATTGFILRRAHPPPGPTYSDVRVLENYYLNKYIHGGKFETSYFQKKFLNLNLKNRNSICQSRGSLNDMKLLTTDIKIIKSQYIIISQ